MTVDVLSSIKASIGVLPAETGGMLGRNKMGVITHFYFDSNAVRTRRSYIPRIDKLWGVLHDEWFPRGVTFMGIVHSHPRGYRSLSSADISYAREILLKIEPRSRRLVFPIVMVARRGRCFELLPYVTELNSSGEVDVYLAGFEIIQNSCLALFRSDLTDPRG